MTILYPEAFRASAPAGFDGLFDWDYLKDVWPRNIEPSDLDAVVDDDIKDRALIFETKRPGVELSLGRRRMLDHFIKIGAGKITVMVLWGKTPSTVEEMAIWWWSIKCSRVGRWRMHADSQMVRAKCMAWVNLP